MHLDRTDPRPAAEQLADALRSQIASGELAPEQRLPSTAQLRTSWGISDVTIRRALDVLRHEGLITSQQGRGTYVRRQPPRVRHSYQRDVEEKQLALADVETRRANGTVEADIGISIDHAPVHPTFTVRTDLDEIAEKFGLDDDRRVLERIYVTVESETNLRLAWSQSYLPVWRIEHNPQLLDQDAEPWPGGTPHQLYTVGIELDSIEHVVHALPATPEDQRLWGLGDGVAMLHVTNYSYDIHGALTVISEALHPADRTELVFKTNLERW